ncbi:MULTISPECIES: GNAT family N-acetyltransferase [Streptomyces]|uniref:GNAT family N-acetyltransferase n=1 Tax=Streptomyces venezuelae TaxID=54571 RepID=A0A5P2AQG1_STRVZ|nr:GNAT family N-acetyltransferase [Streptomyces venezuelae]QES20494.1 GNAT family N-acetyltransferase [Streptomyces venezuelae]
MARDLSTEPVLPAGVIAGSPQPELPADGGLVLRPWVDADVPVFLVACQDPAIRQWHTRRPASEGTVRAWFDGYRRGWERERGGHWAICGGGSGDGEVLGRIALRGMDFDDGLADCAYWVLPTARGARVASRALAALSAWAMGEIGFQRLELDHSTRDEASCRVALASGYVLEGTKRSAALHDDGRHDMHLHARVRDDAGRSGTPSAASAS